MHQRGTYSLDESIMNLDNHDSMLDEVSSIHATMYQKDTHEKRYT